MTKTEINIVWLKRDLRLTDHEPLDKAERAGLPYIIIYAFEPSLLKHPDTSLRHLQFIYHSILSMNIDLKPFERQVEMCYGEFMDVFTHFSEEYDIQSLFSYQESGVAKTWRRDIEVAKFCRSNKISWEESQQNGVLRGITSRTDWAKDWNIVMHKAYIENQYRVSTLGEITHPFPLPEKLLEKVVDYPEQYQPAGEHQAWRYLNSFANKRGFRYHSHISRPHESRMSCTRLSPYLAWGNITIRQAYRFLMTHSNKERYNRAFSGAITRLHWHCHFVQKFEAECRYETHCVNSGYELLEHIKNEEYIKAWKTGQTGYPLIDACMRAVNETGWINFRMRAMLVSFLTLNLDQDWRSGVYHLAQQFLDYDPGIHYPQFQMQAGTTGINTVRLYNPVKNSIEHDSEGIFIKKWIPELAAVPTEFIHEPWLMTQMEQTFCGVTIGEDYPLPIIDLKSSAKAARDKIWGHKKHPAVQGEVGRILKLHVKPKK
ncbi:MAG: deoxyribodipyrimidine photo-lyase/cryptochrome family protein [Crocinitomicaceae bacterium]